MQHSVQSVLNQCQSTKAPIFCCGAEIVTVSLMLECLEADSNVTRCCLILDLHIHTSLNTCLNTDAVWHISIQNKQPTVVLGIGWST